ncbi:hypothetical protein AB0L65_23145 [Nonomuraea sp. NPDC052116]|uniref:hypothetical protein n=1 Tax=Nonomuraea sp. NPDC052116 TaxID=3155665 RepID=UPI0034391096
MTVTPTPNPLPDGDVFKAPVPDETFSEFKRYVDLLNEPTLADQVVAWLPVIAGVAVGILIGVAATLIITRKRRKRFVPSRP